VVARGRGARGIDCSDLKAVTALSMAIESGVLQVILNPAAGGGRAAQSIAALQAAFEARGLAFELHLTERPGHGFDAVKSLKSDDPIVVVGGDGTLHEVIGALLHDQDSSPRTLGLIPLGTGDDFARGAGLPLGHMEKAIDVIAQGRIKVFDAARINGRAFVNGFGSGFDALVARSVKSTPRFLPGPLRYLTAILLELIGLQNRRAKVYANGELIHDGEALLVAIMNLIAYGGGLKINPTAVGHDGVLEIIVGGQFTRLGAVQILPKLARGAHLGHPQVRLHQAKTIRVEWEQPMPAHLDGEPLEPVQVFEARVLPQALRFFVP
jgi:diacylglycerol kinase (ATP)